MRGGLYLIAVAALAAGAASAQTIASAPLGSALSLPSCDTAASAANCPAIGGAFGPPGIGQPYLPLAGAALTPVPDPPSSPPGQPQTRQSAVMAQIQAQQFKMSKTLSGGVAMASALDFETPVDGQQSRVGGGTAGFNGQGALALTYSRRQGRLDLSFGAATSRDQSMAKASIGVFW